MENIRDVVNGAQLPLFTNKKISIIGFINETAPNGMSFEIRCADNTMVKVSLKRPLDKPIEGYVEVHGTAMGKTVAADNFILFNNSKFDVRAHSTLCTLLYSVPNIWNTC